MSGYDQCIVSCYYSGICKDYACVVYEAFFLENVISTPGVDTPLPVLDQNHVLLQFRRE